MLNKKGEAFLPRNKYGKAKTEIRIPIQLGLQVHTTILQKVINYLPVWTERHISTGRWGSKQVQPPSARLKPRKDNPLHLFSALVDI